MIFKDSEGNEIEKGTKISLALAFGQSVPGKVIDLQTGLGLEGGQPTPPMIAVAFILPITAAPNGLVPGVLVVATPPEQRPALEL